MAKASALNALPKSLAVSKVILQPWMIAAIFIVIAAAALATFERATAFATWTDENVHLYVTKRLAAGSVLYRDIHSARPPMALIPLATAIKLGLPALPSARTIVFLANIAIASILFWAGRKYWGLVAGTVASVLYLLAPEVAARNTYTCIHFVALWSILCVILSLNKRPFLSGVAAGLAIASGQHSFILVGLSAILITIHRPRSLIKFIAGFFIPTTMVVIWVLAKGGGAGAWQDLIGRHLYHISSGESSSTDLNWWLGASSLDNIHIYILGAVALFAPPIVIKSSRKEKRPPRKLSWGNEHTIATFAFIHFAVIILMKGSLALYLFPIFPFFALLAGAGAHKLVEHIQSIKKNNSYNLKSNFRAKWPYPVTAALVIITAIAWIGSERLFESRDDLKYPYFPHSRFVAMANVQHMYLASKVAEIARGLPEGQTIFGFPTLISLAALEANRRVSGELADLAPRWLSHGTVSRRSVVEAIEKDTVGLFATPGFAFVRDSFFRGYLHRCYEKPQILRRLLGDGNGIPDIIVFRHREGTRPCR